MVEKMVAAFPIRVPLVLLTSRAHFGVRGIVAKTRHQIGPVPFTHTVVGNIEGHVAGEGIADNISRFVELAGIVNRC